MLKKQQYRDAVRRLIAAEDVLTVATKERDEALSAVESLERLAFFGHVVGGLITSDKLAPQPLTVNALAVSGSRNNTR
ncbi:hypothetical protein E4695_04170 [Alcaligenaceae bacterium 429]|nr:hypothetical protein E4695_04170 [Alcaligenaceae bacterium 429]